MRWIIGVGILVVAGILVARAVMKTPAVQTDQEQAGFAAVVPSKSQNQAPPPATIKSETAESIREINALGELNTLAADSDAVFVFMSGKEPNDTPVPISQIKNAMQTIETQAGAKIVLFKLNASSPDYVQVASQTEPPCVIAMVKGRGMSAVSGDITEAKLVQAFVGASSAGGCGPASAGCGPRGCN